MGETVFERVIAAFPALASQGLPKLEMLRGGTLLLLCSNIGSSRLTCSFSLLLIFGFFNSSILPDLNLRVLVDPTFNVQTKF